MRSGIVSLRMGGSCSGCTSSADTLRDGIEEALRENFPGFVGVDVEQDDAPAHAPPTALPLVQISAPPG
jgi:Fe-S cluster biogenesis protein NfuA